MVLMRLRLEHQFTSATLRGCEAVSFTARLCVYLEEIKIISQHKSTTFCLIALGILVRCINGIGICKVF